MTQNADDRSEEARSEQARGEQARSEQDATAAEKACRDIDRYIAESAQPPAEERPVSPSERLRALGRNQVGSLQPPQAAALWDTPLFPDKS
jgi:hypothetical protein